MFEDILEKVFLAMSVLAVGLIIFILTILIAVAGNLDKEEPNISNAKPIYQQQIGDGAEPDMLIIYEAEVDGVKVYPSVVKESE